MAPSATPTVSLGVLSFLVWSLVAALASAPAAADPQPREAPAASAAVLYCTSDVDANGASDALTDGLLIIRRLFGFSGATLVSGALAPDATRTDPAAVATHIDTNESAFDVDANASADALTDGLLIIRRLFGFSGATLTDGALAPDATRTDPAEIAAYTDALGVCEEPPTVPENQFNIGDSIGEGEAADGSIGVANRQAVWSTGYDGADIVNSLNERFEAKDGTAYYENTSSRDSTFNRADSGAEMADFSGQAQQVVNAAATTPTGVAGQVSVLLGSNDVCADDLASMTDISQFETQFRAGLEVLAGSESTRLAFVHVSSLPAIYWLWESRADTSALSWCRLVAWPNVPCQNLLESSGDDCASLTSRRDPDRIYDGDGADCRRRKQFHARIRDEYNVVLRDVVEEYTNRAELPMPNLEYVDIFGVRFDASDVNGRDCFHPSLAGQALLATEQYCRSRWGSGDAACAQ